MKLSNDKKLVILLTVENNFLIYQVKFGLNLINRFEIG